MERRKFTQEFKLKAVKLIQERGVTAPAAAAAVEPVTFRRSNPPFPKIVLSKESAPQATSRL